MAGGVNLYAYAGNNPISFSDPFGLDTLRYNGTTLTLVGDDGATRWSGRAYSGRPGTTAKDQNKPWVGAIPEGTYSLDPKKITHRTGLRGWLRNRTGDWGNYRAPLEPAAGTETHTRDRFFLHGGKTPGSAGCIDVCKLENELFPLLEKHEGPITVIVDYPSPNTQPTPSEERKP